MTHQSRSRQSTPRCLDELSGHVPQSYLDGARAASEAFRVAGIRHVLVGGLAVGARGYPRGTRDIDFMVGDEAFEFHGLLVVPKAGLPVKYSGIPVDWVSLEPDERDALEEFLVDAPPGVVPVMPVEPLVAMKLLAGRQKDLSDVVELVKSGVDVDSVTRFVAERFPKKTDLLLKLVATADEEGRG
jgi:hypothetical protein